MKLLQHRVILLLTVCAQLLSARAVFSRDTSTPAAPATPSATASAESSCTVTETTLAKADGWQIVSGSVTVSNDANHFACAIQQGDKQACVLDGVVGDPYDGKLTIYFDYHSNRLAYYVEKDKKMRVVVDGVASDVYDATLIRFSAANKHWACLARNGSDVALITEMGVVKHWTCRMGSDGYPKDIDEVEFSPDSQRMAYLDDVGSDGVNANIDGVDSPTYDGCTVPQFSPDSKRVGYWAWRGDQVHAVVDGVESANAYDDFAFNGLTFSTDSRHVAYGAKRGGQWYMVVDGVETAVDDNPFGYDYSPDSQHLISQIGPDDARRTYVDGVQVTGGDDIHGVSFSPDGTRKGYVARTGGTSTVIIDGLTNKQYTDFCENPVFSPDSKRVAYDVYQWENSVVSNAREVVDGVEGAHYDNARWLRFSPDSRHYAYQAKHGDKWLLVIDGAEVYTADAFLSELIFDSADILHVIAVNGGTEAVRVSIKIR